MRVTLTLLSLQSVGSFGFVAFAALVYTRFYANIRDSGMLNSHTMHFEATLESYRNEAGKQRISTSENRTIIDEQREHLLQDGAMHRSDDD